MNEKQIIDKKLAIMNSIAAYDSIMETKIMPNLGIINTNGNFRNNDNPAGSTLEWYRIVKEIEELIVREYTGLFGEQENGQQKSFEEIKEEYKKLKETSFAPIEYPGLKNEETNRGL